MTNDKMRPQGLIEALSTEKGVTRRRGDAEAGGEGDGKNEGDGVCVRFRLGGCVGGNGYCTNTVQVMKSVKSVKDKATWAWIT